MGRYTVGLADLIQDPSVKEELYRIQAAIAGLQEKDSTADAEAGLDTGKQVNTKPIADDGQTDAAIRWLKGPWLLNADGNVKGDAVLRPPQLTTNQINYAPLGIDTAIGLELDSSTSVTISGLRIAKIQRRLLFILNKGQFDLVFAHESTLSSATYRFSFGTAGETITIPAGRVLWLFYDTDIQRWRLFALPAIPQADLPPSLQGTSWPLNFMWFGSRVDGNSGTLGSLGEYPPAVTVGGTFRNSTIGVGRDFSTAAVAGAGNGVQSGSASQVSPQHDPTWEIVIRTGPSIANLRIWALLSTGLPTDADAIGAGNEYMGFRYSTVAGDAGWVGVMSGGGVQNVTPVVTSIVINTIYKLKLRKSGGTVYFSVNGGTEQSLNTNLPTATAQFVWYFQWYTQDAAVKTLTFYQHMVKFGITFT